MNRWFVNLVAPNWYQRVYSRRIDPYDHFFYGSARAAIEAAAEKNESFPATEILQLPSPSMNFHATALDMFALFSPRAGSEGRLVYASPIGEADLYDADENALVSLGRLNSPKGFKPICLSVAHPRIDGEGSMYVLKRYPGKSARQCFEVLESMPKELSSLMPPWRWRLLPPPPFLHQPGYRSITSFTAMVDGQGCATIYVSCDRGIGTYSFETAHPVTGRRLGFSPSEAPADPTSLLPGHVPGLRLHVCLAREGLQLLMNDRTMGVPGLPFRACLA
ncbi:hypothetical protein ACQ4PT_069689 [Festuca glaucescens]